MKKIFAVALGVVLGFALVGSAYAIDGASLESQTTEGLYDRNDAFDITLRPGLLYQVDRWRLYTNLSGPSAIQDLDEDYYEDDAYLIGTSGRLGPGSVAFFYETRDYEWDWNERSTGYYEEEDSITPPDYPNYDRTWDYREEGAESWSEEYDREDNNFYASYSMDFEGFSLGLSYAPELRETTTTFGLYSESFPNLANSYTRDYPGSYWSWGWGCDLSFVDWVHNYAGTYHERDYWNDGNEYDEYDDFTASSAKSGKQDRDTDYHPIYLESQIHPADHWHLLAGIGYASREVDTEFKGQITLNEIATDTDGYLQTFNQVISVNGVLGDMWNIWTADLDGDQWRIYLEPVYEVNDIVTLRLDLHYANEDGDLNNADGTSGTLAATFTERYDATSDTETWTASEAFDCRADGDYEITEWGIEPRVYFNYDPVRFSLGVGYRYEETEWDGDWNRNKSMTWTYDDGDGVQTAADWVFQGSWSEYGTFDGDEEVETWRFPVAAEFDVTEKFMVRAGAAYYRQVREREEKANSVGRNNEQWTQTWGDGTQSVGPDGYIAAAGAVPTPYDATKEGETWREEYDETEDWTTYHVGVGYAFTENLQLDLMWKRTAYTGVDFDELFTSITLAF